MTAAGFGKARGGDSISACVIDAVAMADGVLAVMGYNTAKDSQSNLILVKPSGSRTKTLYASARYAVPIATFDGGRSLLTLAQVPRSFHGDFRLAVLTERDGVVTNRWTTTSAEAFGAPNRSALGSNGLIALSGSGPNEGTTTSIYLYDPIYTKPLMEPKPHHASFYLDESKKHVAGRKYYFHHSPDLEPLTENRMIYFGGKPANRYIQPLDYDTRFHFRLGRVKEAQRVCQLNLLARIEVQQPAHGPDGQPLR